MQIGVMGLGRMGANIARRLMRAGHTCAVYDRDPEPGRKLAAEGAAAAASVADLVKALSPPRAVWVMLPAGAATEAAITELSALLAAGDTIIDGGNTYWKDDIRRARDLRGQGHPLPRRRHLGRRVGPRARLLPDDRWRQGRRRPARSRLRRSRAGQGRHPRHARPRRRATPAPSAATSTPGPAAPAISSR